MEPLCEMIQSLRAELATVAQQRDVYLRERDEARDQVLKMLADLESTQGGRAPEQIPNSGEKVSPPMPDENRAPLSPSMNDNNLVEIRMLPRPMVVYEKPDISGMQFGLSPVENRNGNCRMTFSPSREDNWLNGGRVQLSHSTVDSKNNDSKIRLPLSPSSMDSMADESRNVSKSLNNRPKGTKLAPSSQLEDHRLKGDTRMLFKSTAEDSNPEETKVLLNPSMAYTNPEESKTVLSPSMVDNRQIRPLGCVPSMGHSSYSLSMMAPTMSDPSSEAFEVRTVTLIPRSTVPKEDTVFLDPSSMVPKKNTVSFNIRSSVPEKQNLDPRSFVPKKNTVNLDPRLTIPKKNTVPLNTRSSVPEKNNLDPRSIVPKKTTVNLDPRLTIPKKNTVPLNTRSTVPEENNLDPRSIVPNKKTVTFDPRSTVPKENNLDPRSIVPNKKTVTFDPRSTVPKENNLDPRSIESNKNSVTFDPRSTLPKKNTVTLDPRSTVPRKNSVNSDLRSTIPAPKKNTVTRTTPKNNFTLDARSSALKKSTVTLDPSSTVPKKKKVRFLLDSVSAAPVENKLNLASTKAQHRLYVALKDFDKSGELNAQSLIRHPKDTRKLKILDQRWLSVQIPARSRLLILSDSIFRAVDGAKLGADIFSFGGMSMGDLLGVLFKAATEEVKADTVVLCAGTSDILARSVEYALADLGNVVSLAKRISPRVILCTAYKAGWRPRKNRRHNLVPEAESDAMRERFNIGLAREADQQGVEIFDLATIFADRTGRIPGVPGWYQGDSLHPDVNGTLAIEICLAQMLSGDPIVPPETDDPRLVHLEPQQVKTAEIQRQRECQKVNRPNLWLLGAKTDANTKKRKDTFACSDPEIVKRPRVDVTQHFSKKVRRGRKRKSLIISVRQ